MWLPRLKLTHSLKIYPTQVCGAHERGLTECWDNQVHIMRMPNVIFPSPVHFSTWLNTSKSLSLQQTLAPLSLSVSLTVSISQWKEEFTLEAIIWRREFHFCGRSRRHLRWRGTYQAYVRESSMFSLAVGVLHQREWRKMRWWEVMGTGCTTGLMISFIMLSVSSSLGPFMVWVFGLHYWTCLSPSI